MKKESCPLCEQPKDLTQRAQHWFDLIVRMAKQRSIDLQNINQERKQWIGWKEMNPDSARHSKIEAKSS